MKARGSLSVALAVLDQRVAVLTGEKRPDFVGFSRGGYGNPFDVLTVSGQPLADDFATSIGRALQQAGYRVTRVRVSNQASPPEVQDALLGAQAERALMLLIHEWKSDTYNDTALHYQVTLRVLGAGGEEMARAELAGDDDLGGSFMDPGGFAEEAVPKAYKRRLERLLNDPAIVRALSPPPPPPAPPPTAPTTAT